MEQVLARIDSPTGRPLADPATDDPGRPILLAVSDNGPQMTSGSTREFMALHAIATHFGRPGTPTDQAWIETFFRHLKLEWCHHPDGHHRTGHAARRTRPTASPLERRQGVHAGIGYVTPLDEHEGRGPGHPQGPRGRP